MTEIIKELVELWREFEKQTLEQRLVEFDLDENTGKSKKYFKAQFSDFIDWLEKGYL